MSRLGSRQALARLAVGPGRVGSDLVRPALDEEVAPLLGARIAAGALEADAEAAEALRRAHRECLARNLVLEHAVEPVLTELQRRGIPVVLLKGGALLRGFFQPGERLMWDLDVLVPPARFAAAVATAFEMGLSPMAPRGRRLTVRLDYVRAFRRGAGVVEIHRYLGPRSQFGVDYADLFARARAGKDGVLVPAPLDLFVSLAAHAAKHAFVLPLRAFIDGLRIAPHVDPDEVVATARSWEVRRATSAWLGALLELGLAAAWRNAASALGTEHRLGRDYLEAGPRPSSWRFQLRIARLLDGVRPLAFVTERTALRVGDALLSRVAP